MLDRVGQLRVMYENGSFVHTNSTIIRRRVGQRQEGVLSMQKNVSPLEAVLRITGGLAGLAWSTALMVRHPGKGFPILMSMACAMQVAEGITRFCPMRQLIQKVKKEGFRGEEDPFSARQAYDYYAE